MCNKIVIKKITFLAFLIIYFHSILTFQNINIDLDNILLRLIRLEDVNDIFEIRSDHEVVKLTGMLLHTDIQKTKKFIEKSLISYEKKSLIPWVIVHKQHNKVIGVYSLYNYMPNHFKAEIGYVLSRDYWGKGITTQATKAIVNYCFNTLRLNRIQALCDTRNKASQRVLEKSGFKYEGLLRQYFYFNNEFCDCMQFSILKTEFKN